MSSRPGLSARPPQSKRRNVEDFIAAADSYEELEDSPNEDKEVYPWEEERVREDVRKNISLRLSEPYILKLRYLSSLTRKSQQMILEEFVLPALDKEIEHLAE